jgi:predicted AlkP superfamily phosphohydrolase/phosphomutase
MPAKILFLGFDGADPAVIDEMIADGDLPTLKHIRDASKVHAITNDPAMGAAQFWSSASIGAGPGHHGHYFYMQFKPDTYDIIPNHDSALPDITPFWNVLDRDGYRVGVVDWHRMMPKPMKNGFLIDNWLGHDPLSGPVFSPPSLKDECAKYFSGDPIAGGFACKPRETAEALNDYLFHLFNRIDVKASFCADQLRNSEWDLFIACFSDVHDVGHYFYNLYDPVHELYDHDLAAQVREPLRASYRRVDEQIAKIIDAAGSNAKLFAYGGPGMETFVSANGAMDEMIRRIDLGAGAPPTGAETAKNTYHSLVPKQLRWTLAPLARAVRRKVVVNDYAKRRFFAIPHNDNSGAVRINVKGREKHGIIERGAEFDAMVEEITEGLRTFKNAETGRPLVKRVICMSKLYDGPYIDHLPDLYVEWDRTDTPNDIRKVASEKYGEIEIALEGRCGDHNDTGFFWAPESAAAGPIARPEDVTAPIVEFVTGRAR